MVAEHGEVGDVLEDLLCIGDCWVLEHDRIALLHKLFDIAHMLLVLDTARGQTRCRRGIAIASAM